MWQVEESMTNKLASFAAISLFTAVLAAPANADCNTESSCKRVPKCHGNVGASKHRDGGYQCSPMVSPEQTKNPTCKIKDFVSWTWSSSEKLCVHTKANGSKVKSDVNIECNDSGYSYSSSKGKCVKPATSTYYLPFMTSETGPFVFLPLLPPPTSNVLGTVSCPTSGYTLEQGGGFSTFCKKVASAQQQTPTCAKHEGVNTWSWDASKKVCKRTNANNNTVESTANITCASGFSYNSASGKCHNPGGTFYEAPQIKKK